MKKRLTKVICALAVLGATSTGNSLTIVPTFDSSITTNADSAVMKAAINAAIQVLQTNISDNFTVYIDYVNDTNVSLGQSQTWGGTYLYSDYLAALKSVAADANDTNGLSKLTNTTFDPLIGGTNIHLTLALARRLGLDFGEGPDGFDSTISLNMSLMNFTRPPTNANNYDLQGVVAHEMDEVLCSSSGLPSTNLVWPMDLFRYTTNLVRTFMTNGDNAYFSVDGTNLWARFNQDPGGDYGDWWSVSGYWAPPGLAAVPQVQDAYGDGGTIQYLGTNELAMLDVVGWTLTKPSALSGPTLWMINVGGGSGTLLWADNLQGYMLQERTNLLSGSWTNSPSGGANPATVAITGARKFYRLYKPSPPAVETANAPAVQRLSSTPHVLDVRVIMPRRF